ncbi:fluoride exporter / camphor resistance protein CrcB [Pontimonas salivibrio]|uniref:Fluoride-specific ion channel FluC n=1 Tax=Pontimonas salivibrio TaxID=1159327 RepID=A0A2L2BN45_9MICO|nr:CrcB family protein [Pontimonas salivibrio]AVG23084.1 fluoride exporter / camphor resistance protein CrcB [Pontimonas salivibrio]
MSGLSIGATPDGEPSSPRRDSGQATAPTGLLTALAIAIGGALGALARVGLSEWFGADASSTSTLVITLGINTVGAFALGLLRRPQALRPTGFLYSGLTVGFLGAFTTWSAVMVQLAVLHGGGHWMLGIGYLFLTLVLGLTAAWWGLRSGVAKTKVAS